MTTWDVEQYERYKTYRDRPALDLMVQLPSDIAPREIWDLGCGAGEHAALLAARYPEARIHGLDSSSAMLEAARKRSANVDWVEAGIADFAPAVPPDLIFTNAALQWLPDHRMLFPKLVGTLAPNGVFACQVPVTWGESWHAKLRAVADDGPWSARLQGVRSIAPVASAADYYDWLSPLAEVDVWKTTYLHVLAGEDPIVDWMTGTGLRPYLDRLDDPGERAAFLAAYSACIAPDFPRHAGAVLLDFPRLFIVARRHPLPADR